MELEDNLFSNGSTPITPINPPINKCNYFINNANQTVVFEFTNPYGGIPQNLAFNAIGWVGLIILFAIIRRAAGNYGRLALVRKDEHEANWTQIFFGGDEYSANCIQTIDPTDPNDGSATSRQEEGLDSIDFTSEITDKHCFSWIWSIFTLTDEQFRRKSGEDAVQYLRFQRHLMVFILLVTIICVGIILPINYQGELQGTGVEFGHTTISNLKGSDDRLWVHVVFAILFFPIGIYIMRHFSVGLRITVEEHGDGSNDRSVESRTLMLVNVPKRFCNTRSLTQHFNEAYPEDEISDISVSYDVSRLTKLDVQRESARRARVYCENFQSKHGSGQQMIPRPCGIFCMVCNSMTCYGCCTQSVDALTFYRKEEERLAREELKEKSFALTESNGIAFVTFKRLDSAQKVYRDHRWRCCGFSRNLPSSSLSPLIEPKYWSVRYAPPPEDIYWENITHSHQIYVIKAFLINIFVFFLLFFFTSPPLIISQLEIVLNLKDISPLALPQKMNDFVPTLMLWSVSALLPIIVAYSDWCLGHWRRSVENLWIMRKVFIFLLFMVLILPSVGLTSLRGFFEAVISETKLTNGTSNYTFQWNCIFLPDNGAFFVNYIVTSALVGTALELMRVSELIMYAIRMCMARSSAETPSVRKATLYEFPFGFNYGWMLLVFAMTMTYSVVCPLVTPFGLFYMIMKHLVDRYNIFYAYKRSKINKNIHAAAVNFVVVSLLLQQIVLLCFNLLRGTTEGGLINARVIFSATFIVGFSLIVIGSFFWQTFKGISPIQYYSGSSSVGFTGFDRDDESTGYRDEEPETSGEFATGSSSTISPIKAFKNRYVPGVLRKDIKATLPASPSRRDLTTDDEEIVAAMSPTHRAYGATSSSNSSPKAGRILT